MAVRPERREGALWEETDTARRGSAEAGYPWGLFPRSQYSVIIGTCNLETPSPRSQTDPKILFLEYLPQDRMT
jgi:hypothetical protein